MKKLLIEAISKIHVRMNVMPDLFPHPNLSAPIPRSRNTVRDDKVFLRWLLILLITWPMVGFSQTDGWVAFAKTKFDAKYNEKAGEYFLFPTFSADLKALVGKQIELEGYYLPIDVDGNAYIILSKFPYSQCFFCGGAGPESIAEVYFKTKTPAFEADEFIRIKGKLKLNDSDLEHGNFIVEEAVLVK